MEYPIIPHFTEVLTENRSWNTKLTTHKMNLCNKIVEY